MDAGRRFQGRHVGAGKPIVADRDKIVMFRRTIASRLEGIFERSPAIAAVVSKVMRFAGVGAVTSIVYAIVTTFAIKGLGFDDRVAAAIGYAAALPLNFLAHRQLTFKSTSLFSADMLRYAVMQAVNFSLAVGVMALTVNVMGFHFGVGIVLAIGLAPVLTYFALDRFVFPSQRHDA